MAPRSNKAPRKVRERKPHVVDFILLFMVLVSVVDLYSLSCGPVWGAAFCFVKNKINETLDFWLARRRGASGIGELGVSVQILTDSLSHSAAWIARLMKSANRDGTCRFLRLTTPRRNS